LFPQRERWQLTALAGVVGTALAAAGIFEHFIELLIFAGIAIAPIAGVYLMDFWRDPARFTQDVPAPNVRWRSFAAWVCGIFAGLAALPHSAHGLELVRLTSIPTLDALLAAAACQWLSTINEHREPLQNRC
jgi:cytosine permease